MNKRFKQYLLLVWLMAVMLPLQAQQKMLTMEDAVINRSLFPKNLSQLSWIPGTDDFAYVENNKLLEGSAKSSRRKTLLTLSELSNAVQKAGGKELKGFPMLYWVNKDRLAIAYDSKLFHISLKSKTANVITSYVPEAENHDPSPNKEMVAYTLENNLYISRPGADNMPVTNEQDKGIVNGKAAHRSEFGITKGTFWSPNNKFLAFYRMDESMVTDYPLVDVGPLPAAQQPVKYPMAGGKSHHVTVGIFDVNSRKTVFLQTGKPEEQYLTNITWAPDEKSVYIAVLNREQNHMKLNQYDVATGAFMKTLFEDKHDKYVEPEHGLYFVPGNNKQFVWISERSGFAHLYLYNTDGKLIRQLTSGNWLVTGIMGFDKKGDRIFYSSTAESPLERHFYSVTLNSGKIEKLSQGTGTHHGQLNYDGDYIIDNFSSQVTPRKIWVIGGDDGDVKQTLLSADNPVKEYAMGETKIFPIKADDGTDLYCRMILPPNFDPNKKYPAVVYVYGGPHVQLVTNSWLGGANLWFHLMAQKGYVMFTVDSRGSAGRGLAFEQAMHRQMGTVEIKDQLAGVEYLKSQPFVDANRLGVHGWSYGGFMTTSLMLRSPETFKVGVAGGPVIDWKFYEVMYTERYMGTPQNNPEGYKTASLLNYLPNLKGKLLMIHGTSDDVVVWQHSLAFVKKAVDEGVTNLDYFVYPGHKHNVYGKDRVHLMKKITQYFDENL